VADPRILSLVGSAGVLQRLDEPVRLASGRWSRFFVDGKLAVSEPDGFDLVGEAMAKAATEAGADFDAVGGLVLGAVPFTFAVAGAARCRWFLVRKEPKGRGTNRWVEGARLGPGSKVMIVEDVITTGGSIRQAYERVCAEGAQVTFATALLDRGGQAAEFFARAGVPYVPLLTWEDLGIPRLEEEEQPA
jgi:orotate phosphoribosyltransferase